MADAAEVLADDKRKRMRSPAYPFINLETAIRRAKEFYDMEGRNSAHLKVAVKHWDYEEKSSGGLQTAAALMSFGLMRDEGTGDKRKLQLTPNALRILLDDMPDSVKRADAIKQAALAPKIHQELWTRFAGNPPSDAALKHTLIFDWIPPFNENTVESFIKEFRDTIAFAKLTPSDRVSAEAEDKGGSGKGRENPVSPVGVEFTFASPSLKTRMQEDVFSLTEGKVTFQWPTPLSADSVQDLKDWLKILERKIARAATPPAGKPTTEIVARDESKN